MSRRRCRGTTWRGVALSNCEDPTVQSFPINWLALIVATLAKGVIGFFWYSPMGFLPAWLQATGVTREQMQAGFGKALGLETIGNFIMAFVLVHATHYAGASGVLQGAAVGFLNWLGFIFFILLGANTYEKRPFKLVLINGGYQLAGLLVMGAIVASWM
jgi:Protein of unknown function (DUF1761)